MIFTKKSPKPHSPYKEQRIDFASFKKSIMVNQLLSTNLERILRRVNSPLTRY